MKSLINPKPHFIAFRELAAILTKHRQLTIELAKREIKDRYLGQVLGAFWAVGHPIMLMAVYVFIFAYVFNARIGGTYALPKDFTVYLLSGLVPWMCFQETMSKGTSVIVSHANLVKQVMFPLEVLPVKGVISSLLSFFISLAILTMYVLFRYQSLPPTYLLLPLLVFLQIIAMIGVSYIFSAIGVYFRDLKDLVQVFSTVSLYMMPILYLPAQVPGKLRPILYLNPFTYLVWCYQDVLYFGRIEHGWAWLVNTTLSLGIFYIGYRVFRKLKTMFGNVL